MIVVESNSTIEQVEEYEIQEDNQRGEAKETDRADKRFAKLERENRLLEKKSED